MAYFFNDDRSKVTLAAESQSAASGGTTKTLVTTGEKYTWNNKQNAVATRTATLTVNGWSNGAQIVSVTGVTASNTVVVSPAPASVENYIAANITCTVQGSNSLTFSCEDTPSSAITVNVIIF